MNKAELLAEIQKFGKEVNPGKKKEELQEILKELQTGGEVLPPIGTKIGEETAPKEETAEKKASAMDTILSAISSVAETVAKIDKRLVRLETGDANAFKEAPKSEDIEYASKMNEKVDKRIVAIVEKTLGVDFGLEVTGYDDKPGMALTILVPKRLSPVAMDFRPVKDPETGEYKMDPKTKRVVEEEYWPGDRRTVALGASDSFDTVQKHCNRVRSFIMATYQKTNRPQPEFKIR